MLILILEDNVPAGTYTAAEIRAANPDCSEVARALTLLEGGAYQIDLELGAGGKTTFVSGGAPTPRRALASYRGTLAEVRASSDRAIAKLELVDATEGRR